jgi:hypothetical protein
VQIHSNLTSDLDPRISAPAMALQVMVFPGIVYELNSAAVSSEFVIKEGTLSLTFRTGKKYDSSQLPLSGLGPIPEHGQTNSYVDIYSYLENFSQINGHAILAHLNLQWIYKVSSFHFKSRLKSDERLDRCRMATVRRTSVPILYARSRLLPI